MAKKKKDNKFTRRTEKNDSIRKTLLIVKKKCLKKIFPVKKTSGRLYQEVKNHKQQVQREKKKCSRIKKVEKQTENEKRPKKFI